jgi:Lrp/AsnC family transcriptional regulator for asnA, asnC and gidA
MGEKDYSVADVSGKIYREAVYQKLLPPGKKNELDIKNTKPDLSQVDDIDLKIIKFLVEDSRTTLSAIAGELGIGTSTVYKRLAKLVEKRVIRRFTILANGDKLGLGAAAYVGISCAKNSKEQIKKSLLDVSEVVEIHEVLEPYDLLIKIRSSDIKTLKEGPLNIISGMEGIEDIKPILILSTIKEALYNL